MTDSKHTPGPWRVYENDAYTVIAGDGFSICDAAPGNPLDVSHAAAKANARLIAAAPDMLLALQNIATRLSYGMQTERHAEALALARAAIAKATGQS